jgi:hypothetical protein
MRSCSEAGRLSSVKRRQFNLLAGLSLLLCMPIATMWVRSCYRFDMIDCQIGTKVFGFASLHGQLAIGLAAGRSPPRNRRIWRTGIATPGVRFAYQWQLLGFGFDHEQLGSQTVRSLLLPAWFLLTLVALCPAYLFVSRRRDPPFSPSHCQSCGYDLRATPERCPECGKIPKVAEAKL